MDGNIEGNEKLLVEIHQRAQIADRRLHRPAALTRVGDAP